MEIKNDNLDFLTKLKNLKILWLSLGSFKDFPGLSKTENLQRLRVHQVMGFESEVINPIHLVIMKQPNISTKQNKNSITALDRLKI
ncbi:MAG: hypothetical protein AB2L20_23300 [Mangrovibacterium sp.]